MALITTSRLIHGDCMRHLRSLAPDSVDLVCTDPPYGIGFMDKSWDRFENKAFQSFIAETGRALIRVMKPGAFLFMTMTPRQDSLTQAIAGLADAGFNTRFTSLYWTFASGFPKALNIGKAVDKNAGRARELIQEYRVPDITGGNYGEGKRAYAGKVVRRTRGTGSLEGSYGGFQPKPAVEVIIVAMKPLAASTYADQALKNRKGVTWLDDCRIPSAASMTIHHTHSGTMAGGGAGRDVLPAYRTSGDERFPANLLVSDDVLDGMTGNKPDAYSRFFSLDAWMRTVPFLKVPKAKKRTRSGNTHPTVKPLALMSYLITLGSRPGDVVLDPFLGSGTTAVAAKLLGRRYIGIEREAGYVAIARARVKAAHADTLQHVPAR